MDYDETRKSRLLSRLVFIMKAKLLCSVYVQKSKILIKILVLKEKEGIQ